MKRIGIFSVCALMCLGAMAQESVIKAAKKAKDFNEMVKIITPAFSDPTTGNQPETYFIPGKAGVDTYRKAIDKVRIDGKELTEQEGLAASQALLQGYEFLMKAVEMVPNAVKPDKKTAKEAAKLIYDAYDGFNNAGLYLFNAGEYMKAYEAWDAYITLPENPIFTDNKLMEAKAAMLTDQTKADILFNMGICALRAENYRKAYDALLRSINFSDANKNAYELALSCAAQLDDKAFVKEIATMGAQKFGAEDTTFLSYLIQQLLDDNKNDEAIALVDNAIAENPGVSHYYYMKGFIKAQGDDPTIAIPDFQKAIELDDNNDAAYFWLGYAMLKNYDKINNDAPSDQKAYDKVKAEQLDPLLKEAIPYLEKAWLIKDERSEDTHETEVLLKNAYYQLGLDSNAELNKLRMR